MVSTDVRDLATHGIDQRVVEKAVLLTGALVDHAAETRDPDLVVMGGGTGRRVDETRLAEPLELDAAADLLAAEFGRMDLMRLDQDRRHTGATEHRRSRRPGEAATNDRDIRLPHGNSPAAPIHSRLSVKKRERIEAGGKWLPPEVCFTGFLTLPCGGRVGNHRAQRSERAGWGEAAGDSVCGFTPPRRTLRVHRPCPFRGGKDDHTDAVVTPPSMTMVWPVMKVEESGPR